MGVFDLTLRRVAGEIDPLLGYLWSLRTPSYTADPSVLKSGTGALSAEEWSASRKTGSMIFGTNGRQYDSDASYYRHILGVEAKNTLGAISLAQTFDFGSFRSIFEIGCGDMAQAWVIHSLYPSLRYVATDLDPYIIESCDRINALRGIEKRVLDVRTLTESNLPFVGFDLLISWGVDYALEDSEITRLMTFVARNRCTYLMCSATTVGLIRLAGHLFAQSRNRRACRRQELRQQGWNRSVGYFRNVARRANMEFRLLGKHSQYFCYLFRPASR